MRTTVASLILLFHAQAFSQVPANQQGTPVHQANIARNCMNGAKMNCGVMRASMAHYRDTLAPLARAGAVNRGNPSQISLGDSAFAAGGIDEPTGDPLFVQAQSLEMAADNAWSSGNYSLAANLYRQTETTYDSAKKTYGVAEREYRQSQCWFILSVR